MTTDPKTSFSLHGEGGWALVTALVLMSVMLGLGLAVLALADTQAGQSAAERQKDTAFNVAEAALNTTIFDLGNGWPGPGIGASGATITPWPTCTPTSPATETRCPQASTLGGMYNTPDATTTPLDWKINVYDNGIDSVTGQSSAQFYSDALTPRQPSYDANGDGKVWIRAQATVKGHTRVLVEEVVVQKTPQTMPRATVVAGSLSMTNNGNKIIIDTQGSALQPAPVDLRCQLTDPNCLVARVGQISPDTSVGSYGPSNALSAAALAAVKATAIANGSYFTSCPAQVPSGVAWLEGINCSFSSTGTINTSSSPGLLIVNNATVAFTGTITYYGVIYNTNVQNSSGAVVSFSGNTVIYGSVQVDGPGQIVAGSSKLNLTYDPNAFNAVQTYGSANLVQGTFRQLAVG